MLPTGRGVDEKLNAIRADLGNGPGVGSGFGYSMLLGFRAAVTNASKFGVILAVLNTEGSRCIKLRSVHHIR